jgi:hypothetical protein
MTQDQKLELWQAIKSIPPHERRTEIFTFGNMQYYADKLNTTVYICQKLINAENWAIYRIFEYDNRNAAK